MARKSSSMCISKKDTSSTAYKLTMLILSTCVTFSMTCLTVASLITIYEIQETESEVKRQLLLIVQKVILGRFCVFEKDREAKAYAHFLLDTSI